jgi:hypothetical protein
VRCAAQRSFLQQQTMLLLYLLRERGLTRKAGRTIAQNIAYVSLAESKRSTIGAPAASIVVARESICN